MKPRPQLVDAIAAASFAIVLNTLALELADALGVVTATGGLLRLTLVLLDAAFGPDAQHALQSALPWRLTQTGFHLAVGLLMGIVYAYVLGSLAARKPWLCGLAVGVAVWAINAFVVLPATGEGFAGTRLLTSLGLGWFVAAHFLYFFSLALAYAGLRARPV